MSIIIPSKNIYDIENPKVRDNVIDKVSVDLTVVKENKEYQEQVHSEKLNISNLSNGDFVFDAQAKRNTYGFGSDLFYLICSYISIQPKYLLNYSLKINRLLKHKVIDKLYLGKDNNGNNEIKTTIKYKVEIYKASATAYKENVETEFSFQNITYDNQIEEEFSSVINLISPQLKFTASYDAGLYGTVSVTSDISNKFNNLTNLQGNIDYSNQDDYISFSINILSGYDMYVLGGYEDEFSLYPQSAECSGNFIKCIAQEIELSVYGDTIGIDLTDGSITYGSGNKPFSLSGNELMHASNYRDARQILVQNTDYWIGNSSYGTTYYTSVHLYNPYPLDTYVEYVTPSGVNGTAIINAFDTTHRPAIESVNEYVTINKVYTKQISTVYEHLKQVQNQYAKGKETATLLCSISNYYDENGNKVIDTTTEKMAFSLHDKVVPMIYGADGQDHPMSKVDGLAKVFEVVGTNIIYDGAVWQQLSLQEFGEGIETPDTPDIPDTPEQTQLLAPTISISGHTLQITDNSGGLATMFGILVDGVVKGYTERYSSTTTYNLNKLELNVDTTYEIAVIAKASGYKDSKPSNAVQYVVEVQTLTVINSNNESETATFTMPLNYWFASFIGSKYDTSGGAFELSSIDDTQSIKYKGYDLVDSSGQYIGWYTDASGEYFYKGEQEQLASPTIALSGDTLSITDTSGLATSFDILVDGVVKGSVEVEQEMQLITFTIDGTTYQAENSMTWGEWVESSYNKDGYYIADSSYFGKGTVYANGGVYVVSGVDSMSVIENGVYHLTLASGGTN